MKKGKAGTMDIEKVEELLNEPVVCEDGKSHYIQENHKRYLSSLIYQLFESTGFADRILALVKEALPELAKEVGYVKLSEDQNLPIELGLSLKQVTGLKRGNWRKVEVKDGS